MPTHPTSVAEDPASRRDTSSAQGTPGASGSVEYRHTPRIPGATEPCRCFRMSSPVTVSASRSEEHTSELQSRENLVCRLLLEKKKQEQKTKYIKIQA